MTQRRALMEELRQAGAAAEPVVIGNATAQPPTRSAVAGARAYEREVFDFQGLGRRVRGHI